MPDWTRLATMLPSVVAGLKGSGAETAAFMEGYNRTTNMLKQQQMEQQQVDEMGRRTDLAASEQEYQRGQDALKNKQGALDTLLSALPGLASTAAPSVTGTTSMETPIGSIGVPTVQGPETGVMAQLQSLAGLLDQPDLAPSLGPLVRPAITRAEAARQNRKRAAVEKAVALVESKQKTVFEQDPNYDPAITVVYDDGRTEQMSYSQALKVSGAPPVKATPKGAAQSLEAQLAAAKTPEEQDRILRLMGREAGAKRDPRSGTAAEPGSWTDTGRVDKDGNAIYVNSKTLATRPMPFGAKASAAAEADQLRKRDAVVASTSRTLDAIDEILDADGNLKPGVSAAVGGSRYTGIQMVKGTDAYNAQAAIDRVRARLVTDLMAELKAQSRTGATGFGQLNLQELKIIQDSAAKLDPGQSEAVFAAELKKIRDRLELILKEPAGVSTDTGPIRYDMDGNPTKR